MAFPSPKQSHLALSADIIEGADNDEKLLPDSNNFFFTRRKNFIIPVHVFHLAWEQNYFQGLKIYNQTLKINNQALKIYFQALVIYFQALIIYFQGLTIICHHAPRTFLCSQEEVSPTAPGSS